ncbi:related to mitochondrial peptidyl-tRNA hydrolase Pth2 [Ramularia collo-cygni]|uniref:peptidyl-tRNA hydrolase n=1 Tax=Ramularia collo-cygni TaxID=112498 RepID=A0A2D3VCM1_9PEZI|nr:related to mitochondrial peptidyl-tRNA hydrolase Pth2 [Ramularia collo-cygni]CZT22752.1 related to mitochondrial peptidyl-tRNA hydrolase Pth2 [Ramularia collo-cygni]
MANVQDRGPPSAAAIAIGTAIVAGITGYFLGTARSIGVFGGPPPSAQQQVDDHSDDDDGGDGSDAASETHTDDLGELKTFPGSTEECKLVLAVRTDLGMTKGKMCAQCGHATLACYKSLLRADPAHPLLQQWETLGQAKVALKVDSEDAMLMLQAQAVSLGVCAQVIHDAGRTQIASGSATVLGIGPAPKSVIDQITGHLKLL